MSGDTVTAVGATAGIAVASLVSAIQQTIIPHNA